MIKGISFPAFIEVAKLCINAIVSYCDFKDPENVLDLPDSQ